MGTVMLKYKDNSFHVVLHFSESNQYKATYEPKSVEGGVAHTITVGIDGNGSNTNSLSVRLTDIHMEDTIKVSGILPFAFDGETGAGHPFLTFSFKDADQPGTSPSNVDHAYLQLSKDNQEYAAFEIKAHYILEELPTVAVPTTTTTTTNTTPTLSHRMEYRIITSEQGLLANRMGTTNEVDIVRRLGECRKDDLIVIGDIVPLFPPKGATGISPKNKGKVIIKFEIDDDSSIGEQAS